MDSKNKRNKKYLMSKLSIDQKSLSIYLTRTYINRIIQIVHVFH